MLFRSPTLGDPCDADVRSVRSTVAAEGGPAELRDVDRTRAAGATEARGPTDLRGELADEPRGALEAVEVLARLPLGGDRATDTAGAGVSDRADLQRATHEGRVAGSARAAGRAAVARVPAGLAAGGGHALGHLRVGGEARVAVDAVVEPGAGFAGPRERRAAAREAAEPRGALVLGEAGAAEGDRRKIGRAHV